MKLLLLMTGVLCCASAAEGVFDFTISSGYYGTQRLEGSESLLITGGGAIGIEARGQSLVEIQSTTAYKLDVGGLSTIDLMDNSSMSYYGGYTNGLYLWDDARAELRGGSINYMRSYQDVFNVIVGRDEQGNPIFNKHIEMYTSQHDYNSVTKKLTGLWWDKSAFSIQLYDIAGYDKTIDNIKFIVPEPATVLLVGLGGVLLRRRVIR
jgi:hypothetical protein